MLLSYQYAEFKGKKMENYYLGNGRKWKYINEKNNGEIKDKATDEIVYNLLYQRGLLTADEIEQFLNPTLKNLHDPFLLDGMKDAVERILSAIQKKEKVLIYGDYDADGVSATSILIRFFRSLNLSADYYIPDRVDEGYGISDVAVEFISSNDYDLVITVDCGISARGQVAEIVEKCKKRGRRIDIIITDHHQCKEDLIPDAFAIINPHLPYSNYPFKNLCGTGVVLKLVHALGIYTGNERAFEDYIDIAAIATIADIVELKGENRIIAKFGLEKIRNNPCIGIKALLDAALINTTQIDSYRVSFIIAPRVNAAGRMGDAGIAVKLFTTDNESEANEYAFALNSSNTKRQEIQDKIFNEAVVIIEHDPQYNNEKVIVVYHENWHHGVIGIVASKLVERYNKPVFVFSIENEKAVGSARGIEGFNIFKAMESQSDLLIKYGGHEQAGGLTISPSNLELFRKRINLYANEIITDEMLIPEITIDIEAKSSDISLDTAKMISQLEPFGCGNRIPVFCYKGAKIKDKKIVGNGRHLKLSFVIDGKLIEGVYFRKGYLETGIFTDDVVDIVFTQEVNEYRGVESLQINILDMRLTEGALIKNRLLLKAARHVECLDCDESWLYNGIINKIIFFEDIVITRNILAVIYRYISRKGTLCLTTPDMFVHAGILRRETKLNINAYKFLAALLIFDELELMEVILDEKGNYTVKQPDEVRKVNLEDSEILNWINNMLHSFN
ncbi:MAG: single-stranded-DNA-specific exonuclease RecJ [Clostridiaceae bacterium]|nr:single-stranded-DNA-specific exonuclease RecJ [Clostridiaceae bacterium]